MSNLALEVTEGMNEPCGYLREENSRSVQRPQDRYLSRVFVKSHREKEVTRQKTLMLGLVEHREAWLIGKPLESSTQKVLTSVTGGRCGIKETDYLPQFPHEWRVARPE